MSSRVLRAGFAPALWLLLELFAPGATAEERVDLVPLRAAPWRADRLLAPFRAATRGPRVLRVDTEPTGAVLALAYLRDGAEERSARGVAPLEVSLPSIAHTGDGDRLAIRAELDGFAPREVTLTASRVELELHISLARLPNHILAAPFLELADRSRLTLISERPLMARLSVSERGWRLVLPDVAVDERLQAVLGAIHGEGVSAITLRSLGSDALVDLSRGVRREGHEIRMTAGREPVRGVHLLSLDWVPPDGGAAGLAAAREALSAQKPDGGTMCAAAFDRALRAALDPADLSRALAPHGAFTDTYLTLAIERLAELSANGEVLMSDGSRIALSNVLERERVLAQPASALGLLALLRSLAASIAPGGAEQSALHAWLAPELSSEGFAAAFALATTAEARCLSGP